MSHVKSLRAMFERQNDSAPKQRVLTPAEFERAKREEAEKEAIAILEARKKAAAYNMTVRALQMKKQAEKDAESKPLTPEESESRKKARAKARKFSVALLDPQAVQEREATQAQNARRATQMLLLGQSETVKEEGEGDTEEKEDQDTSNGMVSGDISTVSTKRESSAAKAVQAKKKSSAKPGRKASQSSQANSSKNEPARTAEQEAFFEMMRKEDEKRQLEEKEEAERLAKHVSESETKVGKTEEEVNNNDDRDREVLMAYLSENFPNKLDEVDDLLREFEGQLDVLFEELAATAEKDAEIREKSKSREMSKSIETKEDVALNVDEGTDGDIISTKDGKKEDSIDAEDELDRISRVASKGSKSKGSVREVADSTSSVVVGSTASDPRSVDDGSKFLDDDVDLEATLRTFYKIYVPSKVDDVPTVLEVFAGRERDLFNLLEVKYNVKFSPDGSCVPNAASDPGGSKFLVDVHSLALKERLKKQGISENGVKKVLESGSEMM